MGSSAHCTGDCSRVFLANTPSLGGNAALLVLFAILIPIAFILGIRYKSSIFATTVTTGLALEVVGYIGRVLLHGSPNGRGPFIVYLLGTTTGPTCICGAMFLMMPRIVAVYGEEFRSWRPFWHPFLFYALTTVSLVLDLVGSIVSGIQDNSDLINIGIQVLVAGLAIQLAALGIFVFHAIFFAIALRTRRHGLDPKYASVYNSRLFKMFLVAFSLATILLVVRTAYRVVEIAEGFDSSIAQDEVLFLVLDGVMVLIATLLLLGFFPARAFGQSWLQTSSRRLSQTPPRPLRPSPAQLPPSARPSPTYNNRMSLKSSVSGQSPRYSPRKSSYAQPPPQRNMVDSDALW
ncbi:Uu.00g104250.m01.CDS01 [Anthostomella pinea]|uniref:Uu.00g104250.m01.CDS01 n=1 Tax=Anthostomella pinea TaxID=933095 RepID=A0AAI8VDR5_9PEZI|nr:Uu.00g104250.m01.CDS01 [Anthostomella pinea]